MDSPRRSSSGSPMSSKKQSNNTTSFLSKSISNAATSHSQSFSSILNNPNPSSTITSWWSPSSSLPIPDFTPLPTLPKPGSDLTRSDFSTYLSSISDPHSHFLHIQQQNARDHDSSSSSSDDVFTNSNAAGEALVACLREVPALYFKEDFRLEDGATFRSACPYVAVSDNVALQERLSQYLDVVEVHLVREISMRSGSFFEAQVRLADLNSRIEDGCGRVRELKGRVREVDTEVVGAARKVKELSVKKGDLVELHNKLGLVLSVNQAVATLQLVSERRSFDGILYALFVIS